MLYKRFAHRYYVYMNIFYIYSVFFFVSIQTQNDCDSVALMIKSHKNLTKNSVCCFKVVHAPIHE